MPRPRFTLLLVLLLICAGSLMGQGVSAVQGVGTDAGSHVDKLPLPDGLLGGVPGGGDPVQASTRRLMVGGVAGAVAGTAVGGAGAWLRFRKACHWDCIGKVSLGVAATQGIGLALGVHLADRRAGSLAVRAASALALAGAGLVLERHVTSRAFWVVPPAQLVATVGFGVGGSQ